QVDPGVEQARTVADGDRDRSRGLTIVQRAEDYAVFVVHSGDIVAGAVQRKLGVSFGVTQGAEDRTLVKVAGAVASQERAVAVRSVAEVIAHRVLLGKDDIVAGAADTKVADREALAADHDRGAFG